MGETERERSQIKSGESEWVHYINNTSRLSRPFAFSVCRVELANVRICRLCRKTCSDMHWTCIICRAWSVRIGPTAVETPPDDLCHARIAWWVHHFWISRLASAAKYGCSHSVESEDAISSRDLWMHTATLHQFLIFLFSWCCCMLASSGCGCVILALWRTFSIF